jgi:hypothetical protein
VTGRAVPLERINKGPKSPYLRLGHLPWFAPQPPVKARVGCDERSLERRQRPGNR